VTGNPFEGRDLVIARLDVLSRSDELQAQLAKTDWDLVVVDEAHRMSAHYFGVSSRPPAGTSWAGAWARSRGISS